tara:strand:- start:133 stop:492 length:360 start_codon:yes stop_codon:yes gene_type:complete
MSSESGLARAIVRHPYISATLIGGVLIYALSVWGDYHREKGAEEERRKIFTYLELEYGKDRVSRDNELNIYLDILALKGMEASVRRQESIDFLDFRMKSTLTTMDAIRNMPKGSAGSAE